MSTTNQELEAKFYLSKPKGIEEQLKKLGANLLHPRTHEYNLRFDTQDESLAKEYRLLRLRKDHGIWLTYKGPATDQDGVSLRQEIETEVSDFDTTKELFHALGYVVIAVYEKYRTTYELDGLHITIDEMPFGVFMEIEGEDEKDIRSAAERICLDWRANIPENYLQLFNRLQQALKLDFDELTFENFEQLNVEHEMMGVIPAD